jgi:hypothetical protein
MASQGSKTGGLTASQLLNFLQVQPFCDNTGGDLTPEQEAALHAFLHEILAAYYRMRMTVPEKTALAMLDRKFAQAAAAAGEGLRR